MTALLGLNTSSGSVRTSGILWRDAGLQTLKPKVPWFRSTAIAPARPLPSGMHTGRVLSLKRRADDDDLSVSERPQLRTLNLLKVKPDSCRLMTRLHLAILGLVSTLAVPASAQADSSRFEYTRDMEAIASLLETIRIGETAFDDIRFEPLDSTEAIDPSKFAQFSSQCPLWRIQAMPHSDIRQPILVTWDCTDYRIHDWAQIRDLRQASFWFEDQEIRRVKFGMPEIVSVSPD